MQQKDPRPAPHLAFDQSQVGDAAFIDAGVAGEGESRADSIKVRCQAPGEAGQSWQTAGADGVDPGVQAVVGA